MSYFLLFQALTGTTLQIPTLDGRRLPLRMNDVVKPTTIRRVQGEGLPLPKQPSRKGDLIIEFDIRFPDSLSSHAKTVISDVLPTSSHWAVSGIKSSVI